MLAFFEYPTSFTLSSDYRFRNRTWNLGEAPCGTTEAIEIICLAFILCDCLLRFYLGGWRRFIRKPWLVLYAIMLVLSFVDVFISLVFCDRRCDPLPTSLAYTLRMRRYFRPVFFLVSSTIMKKFAKAVALTLPHIFTVLVLLVIHLYVFAMIGLLAFPHQPVIISNDSNITNSSVLLTPNNDIINPNLNYSYYTRLEGEKYFSNVADALETLLVLLTTANHPDVMMPIYQYNRFAAIYFILFLGIGAYIILNLLIAVIYNHFKGFFQKSLQSSFLRRRVAFRAAFTILVRKTQDLLKRGNQRHSEAYDHVSKELVRELLQKVKIKESQKPLMYPKLETVNSQYISWKQFREIFDLISQDTSKKKAPRLPYYTNVMAFQWFQFVIRHRFFAFFTHFVSIVNVIIITAELQFSSYNDSLAKPNSRLAGFNLFFVIYYVVEQLLKLIGFGFKGYFRSIGNIYEGLLTLALLVLETLTLALYGGPLQNHRHIIDIGQFDLIIRLMNIFIVLRILRILAHVEKLRMLTATIVELIRNLRGFAGIIFVIYYIFALLGMQLFMDVDRPSSDSTLEKCGTYDNLRYFANNFHDFASSLVVLWDIMVVNNWFIFLDKYGTDSFLGNWAKLYFIAWWLVAVIVFVNLFISLVLETFLAKLEAVHLAQDEEGPSDEYEGRGTERWERQTTTVASQVHICNHI